MGVRLTVDEAAWRAHVTEAAALLPGLVPVVKGNGYGFGRHALARRAVEMLGCTTLAVGTVWETDGLPPDVEPLVLTPTLSALPADLHPQSVLTVGDERDVDALVRQGRRGPVSVKVASSMRRYGTDDPRGLARHCASHGMHVRSFALHLPLAGDDIARRAEIDHVLARLDGLVGPGCPLDVSHLAASSYQDLRASAPHVRVRVGTALWHGDKTCLRLDAEVVTVHPVRTGDPVGYRATPAPGDGDIVVIAAGSAHGVQPLADGRSPFHHARRRLTLVEAPHMHSSLAFVPSGDPCPAPGERVDLQRPLTATFVDETLWT